MAKAGSVLSELRPEVLLVTTREFSDGELDVVRALIENLNGVVVLDFIFHGEALAIACRRGDSNFLDIHIVLNHKRGVGIEFKGSIKLLGFL